MNSLGMFSFYIIFKTYTCDLYCYFCNINSILLIKTGSLKIMNNLNILKYNIIQNVLIFLDDWRSLIRR